MNLEYQCPKCKKDTVKDFYQKLWICTNHKCDKCELFEGDFK